MKNIFRFLMAVAVLFTASCAKEDISSSIGGGEVEVTFTANLPELGTRAEYGTGAQVNKLRYYVYDNDGTLLEGLSNTTTGVDIKVGKTTTVTLVLLKGMTYNIVFWADHDGYYAYNTAAKTITVDYSTVTANEEWRDAFYAYVTIDPAEDDAEDKANVTLRRPFAQLNAISTDDLTAHNNANIKLTTSTVTLDVYNTFNLATGSVDTNSKVLATQLFANNVLDNSLISMNYFFASANEGYTTDVTLTVNYSNGASYRREFTYVPLKQNYRTNIIGQLLSKSTDFTVTIDPVFDTPDKDVVQTAAELQQQIENAQPGEPTEIVLGSDIDLNDLIASLSSTRAAEVETLVIPAGKNIVLNLNGCTLSKTKACTGNYNMILNKGNLTITGNGKISFKDTGAGDPNFGWGSYTLRNEGTLVVENGTIEHLGEQNPGNGLPNVHMYCAIFQYSGSSTINGGTISTPTYRSARLWNGDMTINGGNFVGQLWLQAVSDNANLTINGGTFAPCGNDGSSVFVSNAGKDVTCTINGGTFTKFGMSVALPCVYGGTFTEDPSAYVANGYIAKENNGVYNVELAPYYKEGNTYYINNAEGLVTLPAIKAGDKFVLMNNIDLAGVEFNGLSAFNSENSNTFDGNGYTISNWTNNSGASDMGFFKRWVGTIKNVKFDNCHLKTGGRSAIVAANTYANIENVHVENCSIEDSHWACGALAGLYNSGSVKNCSVENVSVKSNGGVGALIGVVNESANARNFENCVVKNCNLTWSKAYGDAYGAGALVGMYNLDGTTTSLIKNCEVTGFKLNGVESDAIYGAKNGTIVTVE